MADITGVKDVLSKIDFSYSTNAVHFLPKDKDDASVDMTSYVLGDANNIRGVSFFAALKALDMDDAPWYINHLRIPGKSNIKDVNPGTQKVVLAILHGLHAYFASTDPKAPSLRTPLPTRFRYVLGKFIDSGDYVQSVERIFNIMKRQYLNHEDKDGELQIRGLINALKTPTEFINNEYFTLKTGKTPINIMDRSGDTETVRDIYVARIPLATVVLGRRR